MFYICGVIINRIKYIFILDMSVCDLAYYNEGLALKIRK